MIKIKSKYFNLRKICGSGQVFRMYEREPGLFDVYSKDRHVRISAVSAGSDADCAQELTFFCGEEEYESHWRTYFDMDCDYGAIAAGIDRNDTFLVNAEHCGRGIRILRQDIWEMMISFIISQQKQIPSIRACIEKLCERFGAKMSDGTCEWYAFPTPEAIVSGGPEGLKGLSLGYRERYIYETAAAYLSRGLSDEEVRKMAYPEARKYFLSYTGIGEKVADCILLFGAGYTDAFPIDTHIKDILYREYYMKAFKGKNASKKAPRPQESLTMKDYRDLAAEGYDRYSPNRGIVQQWIFAYEIVH